MGKSSGIGVLDKTMLILTTVAEEPCSLNELCERSGIPRATAPVSYTHLTLPTKA